MKFIVGNMVQLGRKTLTTAKAVVRWKMPDRWPKNDDIPNWYLHLYRLFFGLVIFFFSLPGALFAHQFILLTQDYSLLQLVSPPTLVIAFFLIACSSIALLVTTEFLWATKLLVDRKIAKRK